SPLSRHSRLNREACNRNARYFRPMATCRRPPCFSYWSAPWLRIFPGGASSRLWGRALPRASSPCYNSGMWTNIVILTLVTLQRIAELYIARRNTRKLIERGGFEVASGHYPLFVVLHGAWLLGLWYLALKLEVSWPWLFAYL